MTRIVYLSIFLLVSLLGFSQNVNLYPIVDKGLIGYIDTSGQVVINPVFKNAGEFSQGLAPARLNGKFGFIDQTGQFVIAPRFDYAWGFCKSVAPVFIDGKKYFIDTKGRILFQHNYKDLIRAATAWGEVDSFVVRTQTGKFGVVNKKGKLVIDTVLLGNPSPFGIDPQTSRKFQKITSFCRNRAFAFSKQTGWVLINPKGDIIGNEGFSKVEEIYSNPKACERKHSHFENGTTVVQNEYSFSLIDTSGKVIKNSPVFLMSCKGFQRGNLFFYQAKNDEDNNKLCWGWWDIDKNKLVDPTYRNIGKMDNINYDIIPVYKKDFLIYTNKRKVVMWTEPAGNPSLFDIDYMLMSEYYAYMGKMLDGEFKKDKHVSEQTAFIPDKENNKGDTAIEFSFNTKETELYLKRYNGIPLYIKNISKDTVKFKTRDRSLFLNLQAKDSSGSWRDIEYITESECSNSYFSIKLFPKHYWKFVLPIFNGGFQTKIRAVLKYLDPKDKHEKTTYSNEIDGGINPAQFWRRKNYKSENFVSKDDDY